MLEVLNVLRNLPEAAIYVLSNDGVLFHFLVTIF